MLEIKKHIQLVINIQNDIKNMKNKDIDEILATGKKKEFQYNKGVYTL